MSAFNRSFISAMPTGAKMYNDSLANERAAEQLKIQQAGEARTAADYEHKVGLRAQTDALREQLVSPNKSNYELGNTATQFAPTGTSVDEVPDVGSMNLGLTAGVNLGGSGIRAPKAAGEVGMGLSSGVGVGMQPAQQLGVAPAKKLTNNKTPERGAASEILAKMAIINGDHEGFARHKQSAADFDYEDGYNGHMKTALSADDKQRDSLFSPLVGYLNDNSKQITMGDPDAKGFVDLAITTAGGKAKFEKLSRQDQAKLYAAHMMMETNPTKAMAVMQSVNKDLAAAIAADNSLYEGVTKTRNDTAGKRHTAEHQDATLAEQERYRKSMVGLHQQRITQDAKAQGDPKIIAAINDVASQFENAKTPEERRVLEQKYNVLTSQLLSSMGKPKMLSYAPGGGGNGKPVEVPDAGKQVLLNDRLMITDGDNGYYAKGSGLAKPEFQTVLRNAALADSATSTKAVTRDKYGEFAIFNGFKYPINDPSAVQKLVRDYDAYVTDTPDRDRRGLVLDKWDAVSQGESAKRQAVADSLTLQRQENGRPAAGVNLDSFGLGAWTGSQPSK